MTKNKRYSLDFEEYDAIWIDDNVENKSYTIRNDTIKEKKLEKIVDLLNEQDQRIQELENENRMLRVKLDTHKHPLWSTREAERVINELEEEDKQIKQKIKELKKEIEKLKEDNKSLRLGFK